MKSPMQSHPFFFSAVASFVLYIVRIEQEQAHQEPQGWYQDTESRDKGNDQGNCHLRIDEVFVDMNVRI